MAQFFDLFTMALEPFFQLPLHHTRALSILPLLNFLLLEFYPVRNIINHDEQLGSTIDFDLILGQDHCAAVD